MNGYKPKTVAIDLDGTLAEYSEWRGADIIGPPFPWARDFTENLKRIGCHIIIHTCRINEANGDPALAVKALIKWLEDNRIQYDEIWTKTGKPIACAYVDDRAVQCCQVNDCDTRERYAVALIKVNHLTGAEK